MTESRYQKELTYEVRAQAYAKYLESHTQMTDEEISQYLIQNNISDYLAGNIRLIAMNAVPDRFSGEVGAAQLDALTERMSRLMARLEADPSQADSLARTYSTDASAQNGGLLENQTKSSVPECISVWCFDASRKTGDIDTVVDKENGKAYWVFFEGTGESGAAIEAKAAILEEKAVAQKAAELPSYPVIRNSIGMKVVG